MGVLHTPGHTPGSVTFVVKDGEHGARLRGRHAVSSRDRADRSVGRRLQSRKSFAGWKGKCWPYPMTRSSWPVTGRARPSAKSGAFNPFLAATMNASPGASRRLRSGRRFARTSRSASERRRALGGARQGERRCSCRSSSVTAKCTRGSSGGASGLRDRSGQVAFPGGKRDASDDSLLTTALREAEGEIALARGESQRARGARRLLRRSRATRSRRTCAWVRADVPLAASATRRSCAGVCRAAAGVPRTGRGTFPWNGWRVDGEYVWGATAAILRGFVSIVRGLERRRWRMIAVPGCRRPASAPASA